MPTPIDWNTTSNFILAIIAIIGFIGSMVVSFFTLRQAKKLYKNETAISLFDKRYEVLDYFESLEENNENFPDMNPDSLKELKHTEIRLKLLFKEKDIYKIVEFCEVLFTVNYFHKEGIRNTPEFERQNGCDYHNELFKCKEILRKLLNHKID